MNKKKNVSDIIRRAQSYILSEELDRAISILECFLIDYDSPYIWRCYSNVLLKKGNTVGAISAMRNCVHKLVMPSEWELSLARIPYSRTIIDEKNKLLYINIPKCASSSVKDMFYFIRHNKTIGNIVHSNLQEFSKVIHRKDLTTKYKDYYKVLIVRNPINRIISYYKKNIISQESLKQETKKKDIYFNLSVSPTKDDFIKNFFLYRNVFTDFRHHTNSICSIAGFKVRNFDFIGNLESLPKLRRILSKKVQLNIPEVNNMKSSSKINFSQTQIKKLTTVVKDYYKLDFEIYGKYF